MPAFAMVLLLVVQAWGGFTYPGQQAVAAGGGAAAAAGASAVAGAVDASTGVGRYPWIPDQGDGTYRNPIILADYSDPDVIRVGADYFLVSSSFNATPALPILRSRDLVNWTIVGHALQNLPHPRFAAVEPGGGVWAPAIREHDHKIYLFLPMPDDGIYVVTAPSPAGPWSPPFLLIAGKGLIDPCPFWDDDGRAYLIHAYAKSRSGIKSKLRLLPMAPDARSILGEGAIIFDGTTRQPTLEGPKLYKHSGWYIVLAPAGGVPTGWQVALRSRDIWGPYQDRVVLQQGRTSINGPHQGALVDTPDGQQWWFVHFQDLGVYGRVVHLNPVTWIDDWPVMGVGVRMPGEGRDAEARQPVWLHPKPAIASQPVAIPQTSDDFAGPDLSPQWQWNANHDDAWYSLAARHGWLRLFARPVPNHDLRQAPHLLLQKFPARAFSVETTLELGAAGSGTSAGLVVVGDSYAALVVESGGTRLTLWINDRPTVVEAVAAGPVRLRIDVADGGLCRFWFGAATGSLRAIGATFQARPGRWIGARVGLFAAQASAVGPGGHADFSYFRFNGPGDPATDGR